MSSHAFSWVMAALGVVAMVLLIGGERGVVADTILALIAGVGCTSPLSWYIAHGYFGKQRSES